MIGTNICIIDDGFLLPAVDAKLESHSYFSGAAIKVLTSYKWEQDEPLKELCDTLIDERDETTGASVWSVAGFRLPKFFRDAFEAGKYRSDLIVFDWEYLGFEVDQIGELKFILENSHAHIIIFTGADKDADIKKVLDEELSAFSERVELLDKAIDGASQHQRLLQILTDNQANNFSFKFGTELRSAVNRSLDSVLHRLAALDIKKVITILAEQDNDPIDADLKEMIGEKLKEKIKSNEQFMALVAEGSLTEATSSEILEIVAEVIKTDVASLELEHPHGDAAELNDDDIKVMEELWSYRLYHYPTDEVVRSGDIFKINGNDDSKLFLVFTPPCDLAQFWKKTDGRLVVAEMNLLCDIDHSLRERSKLFKKLGSIRTNLKQGGVSSFTNGAKLSDNLPGKPFLIPLIPVESGLNDYLLNAHNLSNFEIDLPGILLAEGTSINDRAVAALSYEHTEFTRVAKISDPFCGAILGAVLANISGWGVADYPTELKKLFGEAMDTRLKEPENVQK